MQAPGALFLGKRESHFLESFISMLSTEMFRGQNHGCQHFQGIVQESWLPTGVMWDPVEQKVPVAEK